MAEDYIPTAPLPLQDRDVSLDADLILDLTTVRTRGHRRSYEHLEKENTAYSEEEGDEEQQLDDEKDREAALLSDAWHRAPQQQNQRRGLLDSDSDGDEAEIQRKLSITAGDVDQCHESGTNLYGSQAADKVPNMRNNASGSSNLTRSAPGAFPVQGPNHPQPPVQRVEEEEEEEEEEEDIDDVVPQTTLTGQDSDFSHLTVAAEISQDDSELRERIRRSILDEAVKADAMVVPHPNRKKAYAAFAIIFVAAVIFGMVFGLKQREDEDEDISFSDPCTIFSTGHVPDYELQCDCFGRIQSPGNLQIYSNLSAFVKTNKTEDIYSCSASNVALWWLVSDTGFRNTSSEDQQKTLIQRYALALFYISTSGRNWNENHNWLSTVDECRWHGVKCTSRGIGISKLDLSEQNLNGTIPTELSCLSSLRSLKLAHNHLTGSIQYDLPVSWPLLRRLDISHNALTGKIPGFVPNLPQLMADYYKNATVEGRNEILRIADRQVLSLDFSYNRFTGMIPPDVSLLESLRSFRVDNNFLTGYLIPIRDYYLAVAGFQEIEVLSIKNNNIFGRLPTEIGLTTDLEVVDFSSTLYEGPIPSELGNLVELERLDLSNSSFTGTIPTELLQLSQLEYLNLNSPGFTGTLPQDICDLLVYIDDIIEVDCDGSLAEGCKCCGCDPAES
eukprot:CAMPEP_0195289014 /NCGR_PEP_ID=MMETSP0707-20130614/5463_1 /TAXON_ID=33640 /ORGANISM="Asterionellopsis glacialis, Strain CCMP134" /LENGTH=671 /DNA_ID=CAMNT_0040348967 /DNA_START=94 /DNA_END=2106 /DNA_ORIENTATION=+